MVNLITIGVPVVIAIVFLLAILSAQNTRNVGSSRRLFAIGVLLTLDYVIWWFWLKP